MSDEKKRISYCSTPFELPLPSTAISFILYGVLWQLWPHTKRHAWDEKWQDYYTLLLYTSYDLTTYITINIGSTDWWNLPYRHCKVLLSFGTSLISWYCFLLYISLVRRRQLPCLLKLYILRQSCLNKFKALSNNRYLSSKLLHCEPMILYVVVALFYSQ